MINYNKAKHEITFMTTITENDVKAALGNIRKIVSRLENSLEKRNESASLNKSEIKILDGVKKMNELLAPNGEILNNKKHMDMIFDVLAESVHNNNFNIVDEIFQRHAGEIEAVCLDYIGALNDTFAHITNELGDLSDNYNEN
jgi:hypothetical protein